jgi:hypothetical protein
VSNEFIRERLFRIFFPEARTVKLAIKSSGCFLFFLLALATRPATSVAADWWSLSDSDFITQYGNLATGTQKEQSQFAWMTFARVNQRVMSGTNQFSQWELWSSDHDTFTPDTPRFDAAKKIRTRPHLEPIQQLRMFSPHMRLAHVRPFPQAGQEVTRNSTSYNYIMNTKLNTQQGIATYLGNPGNRIEFPIGAVETKALWVSGAQAGAYQEGGFSLTGLHLMVKVKPTPSNPFTDNSPSWFWTTFEVNSNQDLAAAQKFITYGDALTPGESQTLMNQAGFGGTPFMNYVSNGTQIQYSDANHATIILGNTQIEGFLGTPPNLDPAKWTKWPTSCHSCHGQASGVISGTGMNVFNAPAPVGPLMGNELPPAGYRPYDFVWALSLAQ